MKAKSNPELNHSECNKKMLPVKDALDVLIGKWKLPIIVALMYGDKRFKEISREIPKITDRMLSKELKELEAHQLVARVIYDSSPVIVEYKLTEYGKTLKKVIGTLAEWGELHRKKIIRPTKKN